MDADDSGDGDDDGEIMMIYKNSDDADHDDDHDGDHHHDCEVVISCRRL